MTTDTDPTRPDVAALIAEIRERHTPDRRDERRCAACCQDWPCDAICLAEALETR